MPVRARPGKRGPDDPAQTERRMEPEHDAAPVRPLQTHPEHVHRGVEPTDGQPERAQCHSHLGHMVPGADTEQRQEYDGLRPPQYETGRHPLDQLLGADTADPGQHRHGGEEEGSIASEMPYRSWMAGIRVTSSAKAAP